MTSCCFKILVFIFLLPFCCGAQQTDYLWQPEIKINYSPKNRWSFNFEINNRNNLATTETQNNFKVQHLEFSHFTSYESGFYSKISLGLRYRNRVWFDPKSSNEFRITQQYSYIEKYNDLRLDHRVRFEQRFYEEETIYRSRYRIGIDIPLSGLSLNQKEYYTVLTTETLYSLSQKSKPQLDQRFTASLGQQTTQNLKLQLAVEYRLENYLQTITHRFFVYTTAILKL